MYAGVRLWLALAAGQVGRYSAAQLAASTSDAPATILQTSAIGSARSPALFPAPAGLPLQAAIP